MKTGKELFDYAKSKIGTPYFFGAKMEKLTEALMEQMHLLYPSTVTKAYMALARLKGQVGKVNTDCSGLPGAYRGKQLGSAQLYQTAKVRLSVDDYQKWADGVIVYRKGHVGVFGHDDGGYVVVEAKGINYGTVMSPFKPMKWECGLTFGDITYDYDETSGYTRRALNPFVEPNRNIGKGCKGEDVKWVQWELCEAGYQSDIDKGGGIDGVFGNATLRAVKAFQKSCKISVDGVVGKTTRKYLKAN